MARGSLTARAVLLVLLLVAVAVLCVVSISDGQTPTPGTTAVASAPPAFTGVPIVTNDTDIWRTIERLAGEQKAIGDKVARIEDRTLPSLQQDIKEIAKWQSLSMGFVLGVQFVFTVGLGWYLKRPGGGAPPQQRPAEQETERAASAKRNMFFGRT